MPFIYRKEDTARSEEQMNFSVVPESLILLLAIQSLSMPNMPVIRNVMRTQKTTVNICIVVVLPTMARLMFGSL